MSLFHLTSARFLVVVACHTTSSIFIRWVNYWYCDSIIYKWTSLWNVVRACFRNAFQWLNYNDVYIWPSYGSFSRDFSKFFFHLSMFRSGYELWYYETILNSIGDWMGTFCVIANKAVSISISAWIEYNAERWCRQIGNFMSFFSFVRFDYLLPSCLCACVLV